MAPGSCIQPIGGEPKERWHNLSMRARDFLVNPAIADEPVMILGEVQVGVVTKCSTVACVPKWMCGDVSSGVYYM